MAYKVLRVFVVDSEQVLEQSQQLKEVQVGISGYFLPLSLALFARMAEGCLLLSITHSKIVSENLVLFHLT